MKPLQRHVDRLEDELKKKLALLLPRSEREPALILDRVQKVLKQVKLTPLEIDELLRCYVRELKLDAGSRASRT